MPDIEMFQFNQQLEAVKLLDWSSSCTKGTSTWRDK